MIKTPSVFLLGESEEGLDNKVLIQFLCGQERRGRGGGEKLPQSQRTEGQNDVEMLTKNENVE